MLLQCWCESVVSETRAVFWHQIGEVTEGCKKLTQLFQEIKGYLCPCHPFFNFPVPGATVFSNCSTTSGMRQNWQLFICLYCALGLSVQKLLCSYSGYTEVLASSGPSRGKSPSCIPLRPHLHCTQAYCLCHVPLRARLHHAQAYCLCNGTVHRPTDTDVWVVISLQ